MESLIFDLDNTLYPANREVEVDFGRRIKDFLQNKMGIDFDHSGFDWKKTSVGISALLNEIFIGREALRGEFINYVCEVNINSLQADPDLNHALKHLPHDKYIFTDSTVKHVKDSLKKIEVEIKSFKGVFDNIDSGFIFKTDKLCHQRFLKKFQLPADKCILFEDNPHNLSPASELGMKTVLIAPSLHEEVAADYQFPDIKTALKQLF